MAGTFRDHSRFLVMRRVVQVSIIALFIGGNVRGWSVLRGNLSSAQVMNALPLSDPFAVLQVLSTGRYLPLEALIGAGTIALFYGLVAGRSFCSWVCPVNAVTDSARWFRKRLFRHAGTNSWSMSRNLRYWIIGMSIILSAVLGVAAFEWISPIGMLHRGIMFGMGLGWLFLLAIVLFDIFGVENGFCGHLCPLGGFYSVLSRFSFLKVRYSRDRCTLCSKCLEICPESQVLGLIGKKSGAVLSGECTNCGRCIEVCDDYALKYGSILQKQ